MFGGQRQSWFDSQGAGTYGNANITGAVTFTSNSYVFANTVGTSTYISYSIPFTTDPSDGVVQEWATNLATGNLTVTGNTAILDILLVGAGGYVTGGTTGGAGGQVKFFSNVAVPVGTYNIQVGAGGWYYDVTPSSGDLLTRDAADTKIILPTGTITASASNNTNSGTVATGGNGAGGNHVGGVGGPGIKITAFGNDVTWLLDGDANPFDGNIYYGAGGGGASNSADNVIYAGGTNTGGDGYYPEGYSSGYYPHDWKGPGGGAGAGPTQSLDSAQAPNGSGGAGVIIIRHRAS